MNRINPNPFTTRPEIVGTFGVVASTHWIATAVGMGAYGLRPVAEIQFADYILPAFDQLVSEAARLRYRSNGEFWAPITVRAPYGGGIFGGNPYGGYGYGYGRGWCYWHPYSCRYY